MATSAELSALLKEAEMAYHELVLGVSVKVLVHQNGQRIEYTQANRLALKSYIGELKSQMGVPATNRPMKVFF